MPALVYAVDQPQLPPLAMPDRFRHEVAYFMSLGGETGVPALAPGEYWIDLAAAAQWLDDGEFRIVSPLDSENKTEIELSEEQETWLEWMIKHQVERIRLK